MESAETDAQLRIDEALRHWRQGDCVLGEHWFIFRIEPKAPLTEDAKVAAAEEVENAEGSVFGLSVVTQTCDIVRQCSTRPFSEVCPLVKVDNHILHQVQRGRRPNYAYISGIADHGLVADLDRTMTVEKSVVAVWQRTKGCLNDQDVRRLALSLARKRARMAFPMTFRRSLSRSPGECQKSMKRKVKKVGLFGHFAKSAFARPRLGMLIKSRLCFGSSEVKTKLTSSKGLGNFPRGLAQPNPGEWAIFSCKRSGYYA